MLLDAVELYLFSVIVLVLAGFVGWRVRRALERGAWSIHCAGCSRNLRWAIVRRESVCPHCGTPIAYNPKTQSRNRRRDDGSTGTDGP